MKAAQVQQPTVAEHADYSEQVKLMHLACPPNYPDVSYCWRECNSATYVLHQHRDCSRATQCRRNAHIPQGAVLLKLQWPSVGSSTCRVSSGLFGLYLQRSQKNIIATLDVCHFTSFLLMPRTVASRTADIHTLPSARQDAIQQGVHHDLMAPCQAEQITHA